MPGYIKEGRTQNPTYKRWYDAQYSTRSKIDINKQLKERGLTYSRTGNNYEYFKARRLAQESRARQVSPSKPAPWLDQVGSQRRANPTQATSVPTAPQINFTPESSANVGYTPDATSPVSSQLNEGLAALLGSFQEGFNLEKEHREFELDFIRDLLPSQEVLDLQEQISIEQGERTLQALRGELPVDADLIQGFEDAETALADRFRSQFGSGFENSSAYLRAVNDLTREREATFSQARRDELSSSSQLFGQTFGQSLSGLGLSNFDPSSAIAAFSAQSGHNLGVGNLALGHQQLASQHALGAGQLNLGHQQLASSHALGVGNLALGHASLAQQGQLGFGQLAIQRGQLGLAQQQLASSHALGLGGLLNQRYNTNTQARTTLEGIRSSYDASIYNADRQVEASRYSANSQRRASNTSGLFGAIGSIAGGLFGLFSDVRLKDVVAEPVGRLNNGLPIYLYKMKGSDGPYMIGLLAHQVEEVNPHAVYEDDEGFKLVDYREAVKDG